MTPNRHINTTNNNKNKEHVENSSVKILVFSDAHIGAQMTPQGNTNGYRTKDIYEALRQAIEIAKKESVDIVVSNGDLFDRPVIKRHNENIVKVKQLLDELAREGINVLLLGGNHDTPKTGDPEQSPLKVLETTSNENRKGKIIAFHKPEIVKTKTADFLMLPFLTPEQWMKYVFKEPARGDHSYVVGKIEEELMRYVKDQAKGKPLLCFFHYSIDGAKNSYDIAYPDNYSLTRHLFKDFNLSIGGHAHTPQQIPVGKNTVVYVGSLEKISFAEEPDKKRVLLIEVRRQPQDISIRSIPVKNRRMLRVKIDLVKERKKKEQKSKNKETTNNANSKDFKYQPELVQPTEHARKSLPLEENRENKIKNKEVTLDMFFDPEKETRTTIITKKTKQYSRMLGSEDIAQNTGETLGEQEEKNEQPLVIGTRTSTLTEEYIAEKIYEQLKQRSKKNYGDTNTKEAVILVEIINHLRKTFMDKDKLRKQLLEKTQAKHVELRIQNVLENTSLSIDKVKIITTTIKNPLQAFEEYVKTVEIPVGTDIQTIMEEGREIIETNCN